MDASFGFSNQEVYIVRYLSDFLNDKQLSILLTEDKKGNFDVSACFNKNLFKCMNNGDHETIKTIINHSRFIYSGRGSTNLYTDHKTMTPVYRLLDSKDISYC